MIYSLDLYVYTPGKLTWQWKTNHFEDVSPIEKRWFSIVMFQGKTRHFLSFRSPLKETCRRIDRLTVSHQLYK